MTFGQVNPFGLAYDERGYIYSTDSHSSPLYQLIRGADYPHFSKPEIMAFGPDMKPLETESTALCGIAYYGDTKFPKEYQGNFFIGDALISRVHRYTWSNQGSSPVGKSETDLIQSADPWFRPVNVKLGPDGALYVADFYNAIIGHYEVPLGHPKRDKQRGRIWRITYKGEHHDIQDLTNSSLNDLITALDEDNITTRMAAADQLAESVNIGNTESKHTILDRQHTYRNIKRIFYCSKTIGFSIVIGIFQYSQAIRAFGSEGRREGIFKGLGNPHSTLSIKGQINGLFDIGLGGKQLNFKSCRKFKT